MRYILFAFLILCISGNSHAQKSIDKYISYSESETRATKNDIMYEAISDSVVNRSTILFFAFYQTNRDNSIYYCMFLQNGTTAPDALILPELEKVD